MLNKFHEGNEMSKAKKQKVENAKKRGTSTRKEKKLQNCFENVKVGMLLSKITKTFALA